MFNQLCPFSQEEEQLRQQAVSSDGLATTFRDWCLACFTSRGGNSAGIWAFENVSEEALAFFRTQPWVIGTVLNRGEMTQVYKYLIGSLDQYATAIDQIPGIKDLWQTSTISLGPVPWYPYNANEPMNVATSRTVEKGVTLFVAAGNEGTLMKGNSLNPWSVAPWVIGVGATTADGSRLLNSSSRGSPDTPEQTPFVVAPGQTSLALPDLSHGFLVAIEYIRDAPPGAVTEAVLGDHSQLFIKDDEGKIFVRPLGGVQKDALVPFDAVLGQLLAANTGKLKTERGTSFSVEYMGAAWQRHRKAC